jgi:hypothetical protein
MAQTVFSGLDHGKEVTTTKVYLINLTAANFVAQGVVMDAVQAAIQGVSLIPYEGSSYPAYVVQVEGDPPVNAFAQRETKWLVRYVDTVTGYKGNFEIGGADLDQLVPGTQLLDVVAAPGAALVAAVNTNIRSRAGNPVTFIEAQHVGRAT